MRGSWGAVARGRSWRRGSVHLVVLRDDLRRAEGPVRRERALDDGACPLAQQCGRRTGADDGDTGGAVRDDEAQLARLRLVAQAAGLQLTTQSRGGSRGD